MDAGMSPGEGGLQRQVDEPGMIPWVDPNNTVLNASGKATSSVETDMGLQGPSLTEGNPIHMFVGHVRETIEAEREVVQRRGWANLGVAVVANLAGIGVLPASFGLAPFVSGALFGFGLMRLFKAIDHFSRDVELATMIRNLDERDRDMTLGAAPGGTIEVDGKYRASKAD